MSTGHALTRARRPKSRRQHVRALLGCAGTGGRAPAPGVVVLAATILLTAVACNDTGNTLRLTGGVTDVSAPNGAPERQFRRRGQQNQRPDRS